MESDRKTVLEVKNLSVKFRMYDEGFTQKDLKVISDLDISVKKGEILAIVGSSGSGKSLLAHAILGILPSNAKISGSMKYCGKELTPDYQKKLRGKEIAFVPQSISYLDPLMRVGKQVQGIDATEKEQKKIFKRYNLKEAVSKMFPFQLSGGMARRVLISTAVIKNAKLIIADEPTPGLCSKIAKEAMQNFRELADNGCSVIIITHDIDLALKYADRIAVFYAGTTVEIAQVDDFVKGKDALRHPYTKALWEALPQNGFKPTPGFQPYAGDLPSGCLFAPRCSKRTDACAGNIKMRKVRGGEVRCIHAY
ncbi:ABC transporter ATP-binding protein [Clostridium colicanis]|uniref:Nickel import system ATP-binding protein NikD n=1 Tax=Clostridium colicanis DSM 13634 TaxID=1121305 RepID=A0A151AND3_9CLOT|nr:ABC transporter ATP-binding protein [Clostridium colicanis]KYH29141.1 oligopeptide transport ATP-binding protein OppD [Clostridium colicanis DSM 13634]